MQFCLSEGATRVEPWLGRFWNISSNLPIKNGPYPLPIRETWDVTSGTMGELGSKRPAPRRAGRRKSKGWNSFAGILMRFGLDKSTFVGILLACLGIIFGLVLDGGKVAQLIQPTAALIVVGGTIGAVMIQFPLRIVFQAIVHL